MGFLSKAFKSLKKISNILGLGIPNLISRQLKKWLSPKVPPKEALKIQRKGSDEFIPIVYGTKEVGAIIVDTNVTDASGGADNEFYNVLAVFCYGEIDTFVDILFNGISYNDSRWLKDKNNPSAGKWFTIQTRTGATGQTAVNAVGKLNRFNTETSKYEGLAHAFISFQQDKDQTIWNGEPEITAVIRGKKCYDPRTGLTQYTENPALHQLDYVKNPIYANGLADSELVLGSFIDVANICDVDETATVDTQVCQTVGGNYVCTGSAAETVTFKRFSQNTIIDTQNTIFDNMQEIANAYRGFFPDSNGLLKIGCEKEETSVFSFNADNILSNITSAEPGKKDRYNRVIVRFPNILNKYEMDEVFYPSLENPLNEQWLEEDNQLPNELIITAEYCVYKALALQLAEVAAKVSRNSTSVTFTADATAMELDVGDVFDLTEETRGWVAKTFRISDIEYRDDGFVNITGIQHEDAVYPWSDIDYSEIIGGSNLGDPTDIAAPTGLNIVADPTFSTAGTLTWNSQNNAFIRRFEVSVFQGTTLIYRAEPLARLWSIPLLAANSYSIQVRAVSSVGTLSPPATIAFNLVQPVAPTDINFTLGNFEIEARPVLAGAGLGTVFEFAIVDTTLIRGRGVSLVFTGLSHSTEYTIFARTVNALGVSGWFSKIAVTTANASQIIDLIGEDIGASIFNDVVAEVQAELETTVENALTDIPTESEVQQLIDDSIELVNAADSEDPRIEVINSILGVVDQYDNRVRIRRVDFTIAQEANLRATAIIELKAANDAQLQQIQQVQTDLAGTSSALSVVQGQVNNPTNGLSASFNLAQTANTKADGNSSSITLIQNQINNPTNGLSATFTLAGSAKTTADNTASALAGLQTQVNSLDGDLSQAELILQSTVDELGTVSSRAFLGVTTVTAGNAVINGIVVNGATNALEFRANTIRLTNTAGVVQMYWDSGRGKFVYNGDLVAANFQTATSGYRAEMGTGTYPFWYGTGTKNLANALFAVDTGGNVVLRNATVRGAFLSDVGTGVRVEINSDATYLIWAGSGTKNDANGIFWIKANGTGFIKGDFFKGEIVETRYGQVQTSAITSTANAVGHNSAGNTVEISGMVSGSQQVNGNFAGANRSAQIVVRRGSTVLRTINTSAVGVFNSDFNLTNWRFAEIYTVLDTTNSANTTYDYSTTLTFSNGEVGVISASIKTFENKL